MQKVIKCLWLMLSVCVISNAQVFKIDTVLYNGSSEKRINIVFLSDGYQQSELDNYITDVRSIVLKLFAQEPFSEYSTYFNVFAIRVPSNVSGAAPDPSKPIDNYFGSTFNYGGIDRLLVPV